jgi:hypothetical protein
MRPGMTENTARRRIDWVSAAMALVTSLALAGAAWMRFGPAPASEPPGVGTLAPPLRLLDPATSEPLVLLGLRGKVIWLTFWSADSPSARADLVALDRVWNRLRARPKFAMAAVAIEAEHPDRVRAMLAEMKARLPVYLAPAETRRAFGATGSHVPFHLLFDETGRVGAVARGGAPGVLDRLARQAEQWLDELEPLGPTRFALLEWQMSNVKWKILN